MRLAIAIVIATSATASAERCHHPVVGRDRCAHFGEWSLRHVPLNDADEAGIVALALAPPALGTILRPDGTPATVTTSSRRLVGTGLRLRVLRSIGDNGFVGVELLPGILFAPSRATTTIDGMAEATSLVSAGSGMLVAGVHTTGVVQLGIELDGGVRSKTVDVTTPVGFGACGSPSCAFGASWFGLALDARAQVRWWASRHITITASAGTDLLELGDLVMAVDVGLHAVAYDGR